MNDSVLIVIGASAVVLILIVNLFLFHKQRVERYRKKRLQQVLKHSGIEKYDAKMKNELTEYRDISKPLYDLSGFYVYGAFNTAQKVERHSELVSRISIEAKPGQLITQEMEEEIAMGIPTQFELDTALSKAIAMREKGDDDDYMAKCLLNLKYRNEMLEKVLLHADLYIRNGSDSHEHSLLMKAISDAKESKGKKPFDSKDSGTFLLN